MDTVSPVKSLTRRISTTVAGVAGAVVLAGCAQNAPQDTWKPKGDNAQMINDLDKIVFPIAGIVGVLVFGFAAYTFVKFRDRGQAVPSQSHGKPIVEIVLTIVPALILTVVGVFTFRTIMDLAETEDTEMIINVTGQQWWWEYDYPAQENQGITQPIITSGQLVIPVGTNVLLRETSRDVIHSYWIPALNGKKDAVPGRIHLLRLHADKPGIYAGQCTEFCGLSHANMRMEAVALSKEDFAKWVANQQKPYTAPTETLAQAGEGVFINQCARCHQVNGIKDANGKAIISAPDENVYSGAAPNLSHLMTRNTFAGAMFQDSLAHVVTVEPVALACVGGREGGTVGSVEEPLQQGGPFRAGVAGAQPWALLEDGLHVVPCPLVDQALMLTRIARALVYGLANVGAIVQHPVKEVLAHGIAAWRSDAASRHIAGQFRG